MIQKSELFLKSPLPFFKKKVFFIFNIYIVYLFINDLCHINYNRAVFRLQCFGYFGVLVELFAVIHGDGVHPVFMCLYCPNGCPGSVFGFEAIQFADDGVAGSAFDQGQ